MLETIFELVTAIIASLYNAIVIAEFGRERTIDVAESTAIDLFALTRESRREYALPQTYLRSARFSFQLV